MIFKSLHYADYAMATGLINNVFGPGRYVKTAEIWRKNMQWLPELSTCAELNEVCLAVVMIYQPANDPSLAFLGPIAVDPHSRSKGLGRILVEKSIEACQGAGFQKLFLIGALGYFEPMGFRRDDDLVEAMKKLGPSFDAARLLSCKIQEV